MGMKTGTTESRLCAVIRGRDLERERESCNIIHHMASWPENPLRNCTNTQCHSDNVIRKMSRYKKMTMKSCVCLCMRRSLQDSVLFQIREGQYSKIIVFGF